MTEPENVVAMDAARAKSLAAKAKSAPKDAGDALAYVNGKLELGEERRVVGFVQRGTGNGSEFDIHLSDGTLIEVGSATALLHPQKFEAAFAVAGVVWPERTFSRLEQKKIAEALLSVREVVGGDEREQTREWLAEWIDFYRDQSSADGLVFVDFGDPKEKFDTLARDEPIFRASDGRVYLRRPHFFKFVSRQLSERTTSVALGKRLERVGFERPNNEEGKIAARWNGQVVTRSFYASPAGWSAGS